MFSLILAQTHEHEHTHKTQTKPQMNCLILWNNQDAAKISVSTNYKTFPLAKKKQGQDYNL